jgi:hypothetical protein
MVRGCLAAVGIAVAIFSSFFVAAAVVEMASGGDGKTSPGVYAGLLVVFGGMLAGGVYLAWQMLRRRPAAGGHPGQAGGAWGGPPTEADRERQVLRFAESEHGRVTIPEVATRCDMTVADAKATLDRLVLHGAATIQVTQSGVLVYVFPGFMTDEEKARAQDF